MPVLDKTSLVGGCLRLPLQIDALRLRSEVDTLPPDLWRGTGGRAGAQKVAEAIFLRGYAPAEGEKPIEDRPPLALLPYTRFLMTTAFGASPQRCLLARLPAGAVIDPHIDQSPYSSKTLRLHLPIVSCDQVAMYSAGLTYRMRPGEAWVLNNSDVHGVWNASATLARVHMICDFTPSPVLLDYLARGERDLGTADSAVAERLFAGSGKK